MSSPHTPPPHTRRRRRTLGGTHYRIRNGRTGRTRRIGGGGGRRRRPQAVAVRCNPKYRRLPGNCLTPQHRARLLGGSDREAVLADAYVPKRPKKWSKNAHEWLTNEDIDQVLDQYAKACPHFYYTGFGFMDFAADARAELAARPAPFRPLEGDDEDDEDDEGGGTAAKTKKSLVGSDTPAPDSADPAHCVMPKICALDLEALARRGVYFVATVLNISRHVEKGMHWVFVALWLPPLPSTAAPQMVYFDSNADDTPPEITAWRAKLAAQCGRVWKRPLAFRCNTVARQETNTECGMYVLFCIVSIVQGRWLAADADADAPSCASADSVPRMLDQLLDERTHITDSLVAKFRHIFFRS